MARAGTRLGHLAGDRRAGQLLLPPGLTPGPGDKAAPRHPERGPDRADSLLLRRGAERCGRAFRETGEATESGNEAEAGTDAWRKGVREGRPRSPPHSAVASGRAS